MINSTLKEEEISDSKKRRLQRKQFKKDQKKRLKFTNESSDIKTNQSCKANETENHSKNMIQKTNQWNFQVDYNDHFETPFDAYKDIYPILNHLALHLKKDVKDLVVYDPYYCKGSAVLHLKSLGIINVINRNRDFYADIKKNALPEYDILITNPPYSGEHKQKLLEFLSTRCHCPFFLLLPVYTASKSYWKDFVHKLNSSSSSIPSEYTRNNNSNRDILSQINDTKKKSQTSKDYQQKPNENNIESPITPTIPQSLGSYSIYYLLPPNSYTYFHPEGTGKDTPPFYSSWFIGTPYDIKISKLFKECNFSHSESQSRSSSSSNGGSSDSSSSGCTYLKDVDALVKFGFVKVKRLNPKRRNKFKKLM